VLSATASWKLCGLARAMGRTRGHWQGALKRLGQRTLGQVPLYHMGPPLRRQHTTRMGVFPGVAHSPPWERREDGER
jgi:hypothetical protein